MADSIDFTAAQSAAIDAEAAAKSCTRADLLQGEAEANADGLRADQANARWHALDLDAKEALLPAA